MSWNSTVNTMNAAANMTAANQGKISYISNELNTILDRNLNEVSEDQRKEYIKVFNDISLMVKTIRKVKINAISVEKQYFTWLNFLMFIHKLSSAYSIDELNNIKNDLVLEEIRLKKNNIISSLISFFTPIIILIILYLMITSSISNAINSSNDSTSSTTNQSTSYSDESKSWDKPQDFSAQFEGTDATFKKVDANEVLSENIDTSKVASAVQLTGTIGDNADASVLGLYFSFNNEQDALEFYESVDNDTGDNSWSGNIILTRNRVLLATLPGSYKPYNKLVDLLYAIDQHYSGSTVSNQFKEDRRYNEN